MTKDTWKRAKERINHAFEVLNKLHEEAWNRDSVIAESLLDTQLGKMRKLICRKDTHNALLEFTEIFNESFEAPELELAMKEAS